jgi:hypothetical protein
MKSMKDRKMDMSKGMPASEGFFPESPERKIMARVGETKGFSYPDKEEDIHRDQQSFVKDVSKAEPQKDFRH